MKNILGIPGNPTPQSASYKFLKSIGSKLNEENDFTIYDNLLKLPLFDPSVKEDNHPIVVKEFRKTIESADLILIVTPEYIAGVPSIIKNALEWLVSTGESHNKLFSYIVISPRGNDAYDALRKHIEIIDGVIKDNCSLLINGGQRIQNEDGIFIDESINVKVNDLISSINHL